ncbi:MAG TPA: hypothetical protein VGB76_00470 [Pyrinomonadaceae bacterium]|jgi:hypothetical protein
MNDRFSPDSKKVRRLLENLINTLSEETRFLVDAYESVTGSRGKTVSAVNSELATAAMGQETPWVLYDTISTLIRRLPLPSRAPIIEAVEIKTGHANEMLRPNPKGNWQTVWQVDRGGDPEDRYVALDWYAPPDNVRAPIVPTIIIDYIAGCVSLLESNLTLPSLALLLIALESTLWDDLEHKGVSRSRERVTYPPVEWEYKRVQNRLVCTIAGADKDLSGLDAVAKVRPAVGKFEIRKIQVEGTKVILRAEVDDMIAGFFASEVEASRETFTDKGLSEAVQRARKEGSLVTMPAQLDETLVKLRNNLVHLPSGGSLDPPVPVPFGGEFKTFDELRQDLKFIRDLMHIVVDLINNLYAAH